MNNWSLKNRLRAISIIVLFIAFSIIYFATESAYSIASKNRLQESMNAQVYALMAIANDENNTLSIPDILRNQRLDNLSSGLVAYVLNQDGSLVWRSPSSEIFESLPRVNYLYSMTQLKDYPLDRREMFWVGESIIWEHDNQQEKNYYFIVGEKQSLLISAVDKFKNEVFFWLSISGVLLIIFFSYALNFFLQPLKNAQQQIELVSQGKINKLEGDFPVELKPLTSSINQLLQSEARQKNRYRDSLGNLAHSLKTPLAIIKSMIESPKSEEQESELISQIKRIDDIVKYQLNRSVISSGQTLIRSCVVEPEVVNIISALNKVHRQKNIKIEYRIENNTVFPGDSGDLLELIGNLADNACKWTKSMVVISAKIKEGAFCLYIDDDGKGIAKEHRDAILNRGKRLDQKVEGQGLGLSIVMDIITHYRGEITIENSALGGALFKIIIPLT